MPTFDSTRLPSGWTLSGGDLVVTNTSGGSTPAWAAYLTPVRLEKIYFEVVYNASSGSNASQVGMIPVAREDNYADGTQIFASDNYPGITLSRTGNIVHNGVSFTTGFANRSYANGDVIGIAFNGLTGEFWTRRNGTWDRNPTTQSARVTILQPSGLGGWRVAVTCRDQTHAFTLRRTAASLSGSVPTGFLPLEDLDALVRDQEIVKAVAYVAANTVGIRSRKSLFYTVSELTLLRVRKTVFYAVSAPFLGIDILPSELAYELEAFPPDIAIGASVFPDPLGYVLAALSPDILLGYVARPPPLLYALEPPSPFLAFGGAFLATLPAIHTDVGRVLYWGAITPPKDDLWLPLVPAEDPLWIPIVPGIVSSWAAVSPPVDNLWTEIEPGLPDQWTDLDP